MGIKGLMKFLSEHAPESIREITIESCMGRRVAVDASMALYQFLIAIRDAENYGNLTNDSGEVTSHISGMLSRITRLLEAGMKPVFIFDGKGSHLKSNELLKRAQRRDKATQELEAAKEEGNDEDIKKFNSRTIKITQQHISDIKELLQYLGVPSLHAIHDAEAQCAYLAANGFVDACVSDDTDLMPFGSPLQIRNLHFSAERAKTFPLQEVSLPVILRSISLSYEQFVEFCILCGNDYTEGVRGVGSNTALRIMRDNGSLEKFLEANETQQKYTITQDFLDSWKIIKDYFITPPVVKIRKEGEEEDVKENGEVKEEEKAVKSESGEKEEEGGMKGEESEEKEMEGGVKGEENGVKGEENGVKEESGEKETSAGENDSSADEDVTGENKEEKDSGEKKDQFNVDISALQSGDIDFEGLRKFLIEKHNFNEKRVDNICERLKKAKKKSSQTRLENFFGKRTIVVNQKRIQQETEARQKIKNDKLKIAAEKRKVAAQLNQLNKKKK